MRERLAEIWSRLHDEPSQVAGWKRLRVSEVEAGPVYLARSLSTGMEGLILEFPTRSLPSGALLPEARGFNVRAEPLRPGPEGETRLILSLSESAFRDVFFALSHDVAQALLSTGDPASMVKAFLTRLRRWQRFLEQHGPDGMSDIERRGLFGELLVLRDLLEQHDSDPSALLAAWKGPKAAYHDFVLPKGNIEVKTTASLSPVTVSISNLSQLDDNGVARLILLHTIVAENASNGLTLPDLVAHVRDLSGDAAGYLAEALVDAGYLEEHEAKYRLPLYQLIRSEAYRVGDGFPRLTAASVPPGVTSAKYSIELSSMGPFKIESFTVLDLL